MAQITVQKGDTLSGIGSKLGIDWRTIYEANKSTIGGNPNLIRAGQVLNVPDAPGAAPASPAAETPAGNIQNTLPTTPPNPLANIRTALRDALNEAGRRRVEGNFEAVAPIAEGLPPGSMQGVVELIRGGIKTSTESVFGDIMDAREEEQQRLAEQKKTAISTLGILAESGAMLNMGPDALMVLEQQAGLPQGTALAWKVRLEKATKISDEKAALELELIKTQIQENIAQAGAANRSNRDGGPGSTTSGVVNSKVEASIREDVVSLRRQVANKEISEQDALQTLRTLYSPAEASDQALLSIWGIKAIGQNDVSSNMVVPPGGGTPTISNTPYSVPNKGTVIGDPKKIQASNQVEDAKARAAAIIAAYNATKDPNERNRLKNELNRMVPQMVNGVRIHNGL